FLSWTCIVFTVGMFSTGLTDLKKMRASQSSDNVQFLPFLTTCLNNLGWFYYGMLKKDATLRHVSTQTLTGIAVLCAGWLYFSVILGQGDTRLAQLGLVCSVFTISMYLSPLTDLVEIIRGGSVERLSFPLTVATMLTSTSWTLYGLQLQDFYIMVPNMPGILTSLIRFYLFWKFASTNQDKPSYKTLQI
ncbi:sugar transporter SWEET1-like, partial [Scleropages formosus]